MNLRPEGLVRTRRGLGGVKLFDLPGVIYPQSMLAAPPGMHPRTGRPYSRQPRKTVSSELAAKWFGILPSSVRILLHRHKVRYYIVQKDGCPRMVCWSLCQVRRLLEKMPREPARKPRGMLTLQQAMALLPCTRSTLQRHTAKGRVRVVRRRHMTPYGMRVVHYYDREDVKKLGTYLKFCARQRAELKAKFG